MENNNNELYDAVKKLFEFDWFYDSVMIWNDDVEKYQCTFCNSTKYPKVPNKNSPDWCWENLIHKENCPIKNLFDVFKKIWEG